MVVVWLPNAAMTERRRRGWLLADVWDVLGGAEPTHLHLRNRLATAALATLGVLFAASTAMYVLERDEPSSGMNHFGDALYWTATHLMTVSSSLSSPVTGAGKAISVLVGLYAITVVSALAGMFGAFFHRRGEERDPVRRGG